MKLRWEQSIENKPSVDKADALENKFNMENNIPANIDT